MNKKYLLYLAISLLFISCKKDKDESTNNTITSQTVTIISSGTLDGHIINSTPKTIKDAENTLDMGWSGGKTMRSFLSFDISNIISSGKKLVIEKAILKVYEYNTNMLPFTGEGVDRVVETYLIDYGTLDATDFDKTTIANCGVLTNTGYNVLKEYTQNVTTYVVNYLGSYTAVTKLQFRLQFTHNDNVPTTSTLEDAMWRIYSGDDQGATYNPYRPVIVITYHWEN
jgi:hypothetical protein